MLVAFKGKLKAAVKFLPGLYIRTPNAEYEKFWEAQPHEVNLWYDSKLGRWIFGSEPWIDESGEEHGETKTWIYSEDDVISPQVVTNWKYRKGRQIESDDILVQRIVESGTQII